MSCCCNSNPCICVPQCPEDCPEVIEYSAANINLAGIGVYDSESSNQFQFRGVRSSDGVIGVALNNDFHTIDLSLSELNAVGTKVFTSAANRDLTIPAFEGQLGVQTDTDVVYYSTGTSAGNWATDFTFLSGKTTPMANGTIVQVANLATVTVISPTNNSTWDFENLNVNFDNCNVTVEADSDLIVNGPLTVAGASTFSGNITSTSAGVLSVYNLNFTGDIFQINGVDVPFESLIGVNAGPSIQAYELTTFLSTENTQTGYTTFTNPGTIRTCDTASVTLPELAKIVGTLIEDLKAVLLPAT